MSRTRRYPGPSLTPSGHAGSGSGARPDGHHNFDVIPPIRSERPVFDLRWVDDDRYGATGVGEVWRKRKDHDEQWLPLHAWKDDGGVSRPRDGDASSTDDVDRGRDELEQP